MEDASVIFEEAIDWLQHNYCNYRLCDVDTDPSEPIGGPRCRKPTIP